MSKRARKVHPNIKPKPRLEKALVHPRAMGCVLLEVCEKHAPTVHRWLKEQADDRQKG